MLIHYSRYMDNKLLSKDRELRAEMQDLISVAKREKRQLTEDEQKRFDELRAERAMIDMEVEAEREIRNQEVPQSTLEKRFAEIASDAITRGGQTRVEMRETVITEAGLNDSQVGVQLQSIIKPLQENFILNELGLTLVNATHGDPVWSKQGTITASVLGENEEVGLSQLDFEALTASPKRISVSVPVSNRAITRSNYDLYSIVTSAMGEACARKLNEIVLSDKAVGAYNGLFQDLDSKNKVSGALDWAGVIDLEGAVLNQNVNTDKRTTAYVLGTKAYSTLKKTVIEKGDSKMILDIDKFVLNGYKLLVSNYGPEKKALFADFGQSGVCYYGGANLVIDPYTMARKNIVLFTLNMDADVVRFRKEAFAQMTIGAGAGSSI